MLDFASLLEGVKTSGDRLPPVETPEPAGDGFPLPDGLQVLHEDFLPLLRDDVIVAARRRWQLGAAHGLVTTEVTITLWFTDPPPPAERLSIELERQMRRVPRDRVRRLDKGPGEVAVGWSWESDGGLDVIGMLRASAVVAIRGSGATPLALLQQVDRVLQKAPRTKAKRVTPRLQALGTTVAPLARVDLGAWPEAVVSRCTRGHVNRDPDDPSLAYYRAPREAGPVTVSLAEPLPGLLVRYDRVDLAVTAERR